MQRRKEICEQLQEDLLSYFENNSNGQPYH